MQLSEVQAVFTTAGDPDALVWLQVPDVERLGQVIEQLRRRGRVTGTKTLIVLDTWSRHRALEANGLAGPLVRRDGRAPFTAALAVTSRSPCSRPRAAQSHDARRAPPTTTSTRPRPPRPTTAGDRAGTWSKADPRRPQRQPLRRVVPGARLLRHGSTDRTDLPAVPRQGQRPRPAGARPRRPRACPTSRAPPRPSAPPRPNLNQVALLNGIDAGRPRPPSPRPRASRRSTAPGPPSASPSTARGTRSPTTAAAGPATSAPGGGQPDLVRVPDLLRRRRGRALGVQRPAPGPSRATSTPRASSTRSPAPSTTFCVMVDSNGAVLTWNGSGFSAPQLDRHRAAPHRHQRLGPDRRLVPHDDLLPRRRLHRAGLRLERHDLERRHPHRQRPRAHEHLVPDDDLLRRRRPVGQRVRLELAQLTRGPGRAARRAR